MLSSSLRTNKKSYATAGAIASIPILALAQGAYYLTNFRSNHGNAPYPISPSRGIVIVSPTHHQQQQQQQQQDEDKNDKRHMKNIHDKWLSIWKRRSILTTDNNNNNNNHIYYGQEDNRCNDNNNNPLRIFVVGDSLAAGVGSTQGTPVLPEAIARSLSKAMGGRPVHWTCLGTPGASTSRIMRDIKEFTSDDYNSLLIDQQQLKRGSGEEGDLIRDDTVKLSMHLSELKGVIVEHLKNVIRSLKWKQRRIEEYQRNKSISCNSQDHCIGSITLSESRFKINEKIIDIIHDIQNKMHFRRILRRHHTIAKNNNDEESCNENKEKAEWKQWNANISKSTILKRKDAAQYDVVIVLTGLNDLKSKFLPFMIDEDVTNDGTFKEELRKIFYFLIGKKYHGHNSSGKMNDRTVASSEKHKEKLKGNNNDDDDDNENRALVVVPALPTLVLPMLQYPPLCWIIHTLFHLLDEEKRSLSKEYPGSLLFIEAPTIEMIDEIERGEYFLCAQRKTEKVLLALKDVTIRVRGEIEGLIRKHIENHDFNDNDKEIELHYEASKHHNLTDNMPDVVGSKLVSIDKIHPNDDGYDFWGRHIAEGIIRELKLKKKSC